METCKKDEYFERRRREDFKIRTTKKAFVFHLVDLKRMRMKYFPDRKHTGVKTQRWLRNNRGGREIYEKIACFPFVKYCQITYDPDRKSLKIKKRTANEDNAPREKNWKWKGFFRFEGDTIPLIASTPF